ncbi:MAG: TIGR03545 family protein [Candidatus Margulisbacteria bacterium]|jgi:uncharacterized protein (TIGR03545 family)|nr:TIGR03545 family protein [Candidatus Margulisiibacteriota bacterium]
MLNWKKLLPALVLLLAVIFGFNPLLKFGLEKAGAAAFGAKTEISGFLLNPFSGRLDIRRIQAANKNAPFTNLFEVGAFRLDLSVEQLLYKRVNIAQATIDNIRLGTPRQTSGALPQKKQKVAAEKKPLDLNKLAKDLQLNPAAVQEAFRLTPPQIGAEASRVQKENEKLLADAQKQIAAYDVSKELAALNLDELGSLSISSPADLQKLQNLVEEKQRGLQKIIGTLEANKKAGETALREAQKNLAYLDQTRQTDLANLMASLNLDNYDLGALGQELLGPKIGGWLDLGQNYLALAQKYLPAKKEKTPARPAKERLRGTTVIFPNNKTRPRFWLGRLGLSGVSGQDTANELTYSGYVNDIASEPDILGRPTLLKIKGAFTKRPQSLLDIDITLDHRGESGAAVSKFVLSGYDLTGAQFWDTGVIPLQITGGLGRLEASVNIVDGELSGKLSFLGRDLQYARLAADGLAKLAAEAIASAPELRVDVLLGGSLDAPDIRLTTNLDALIKARLDKEISGQIESAKAQLLAEYDKALGGARDEAASVVQKQQEILQNTLAAQQAALDSEKAKIEARQKELEDQLNSQTDQLKKQAEEALKNALPGLKF